MDRHWPINRRAWNHNMNLCEQRKREFEIYRQKLTRQFLMEWEDNHRASNMADPPQPLRREADSTPQRRFDEYISKVRALFEVPYSPPNITIKPRPITVGTQTWPTTNFKPKISKASTPENTIDMPIEIPAVSKPNTVKTKAEPKAINSQSNAGNKKSAIRHKITKVYKNKNKKAKSVGFNIVSKTGKHDYPTSKWSVSPITSTDPSPPFQ